MAPVVDGWSNTLGGAPVVSELNLGLYQVTFPGAGVPKGQLGGHIGRWPPGTRRFFDRRGPAAPVGARPDVHRGRISSRCK